MDKHEIAATRGSTAFAKGRIEVLTLSEDDIKATLDLGELLDVLADGFRALSRGDVVNPDRPQLDIPGAGYSLAMSAWMPTVFGLLTPSRISKRDFQLCMPPQQISPSRASCSP